MKEMHSIYSLHFEFHNYFNLASDLLLNSHLSKDHVK